VDYNLLLAVHGTTVTLVINNTEVFTHVFDPRVDADGYAYGLSAGMIGIGANNSVSRIDNLVVQVLPPEITYHGELEPSVARQDFGLLEVAGDWEIDAAGIGADGLGIEPQLALIDLGLEGGLAINSITTIELSVLSGGRAGAVFDYYGPRDYKFVALDVAAQEVVYGHHSSKGGMKIDATVSVAADAGSVQSFDVSLKGLTVSVEVNGQIITGYAYNAVVVDGEFGLFADQGVSNFSHVVVETDDAAFDGSTVGSNQGDEGSVVSDDLSAPAVGDPQEPIVEESSPTPAPSGNGKKK
jgi:hypothetical protein